MSSVLKQHRVAKQRTFIRKIVLRISLICVAIGGGAAILLWVPQLRFWSTSVSGNTAVSSEEILNVTNNFLGEKIFILFPQGSVFLFRSFNLEARILEAFPHIATVDVSHSFQRKISITITERAMWGLYCKDSALPCFYITEDGVITAEAPQLTGTILFRINDKRPGLDTRVVGNTVIEEPLAARIRQVTNMLAERHHIMVREVILGDVFEDNIKLITTEGWYILFDEQTHVERAFENLLLVLEKQITDRADLEYIDIRFDGKVFYKY